MNSVTVLLTALSAIQMNQTSLLQELKPLYQLTDEQALKKFINGQVKRSSIRSLTMGEHAMNLKLMLNYRRLGDKESRRLFTTQFLELCRNASRYQSKNVDFQVLQCWWMQNCEPEFYYRLDRGKETKGWVTINGKKVRYVHEEFNSPDPAYVKGTELWQKLKKQHPTNLMVRLKSVLSPGVRDSAKGLMELEKLSNELPEGINQVAIVNAVEVAKRLNVTTLASEKYAKLVQEKRLSFFFQPR